MVRTHLRRVTAAALATLAAGTLAWSGAVSADEDVVNEGPAGAAEVSLIGDSTLTGVRWYDDYGELRRYDFVLNAESCRRTVGQSCISREGYRSENVIATMRNLDGRLGEVLVVMSGYNDPEWAIDEAIGSVLDEAQRQGVDHVVWLTLRASDDVNYSDPQEQTSINTFREYNEQLVAAAEENGVLQVADWATFSNGASDWFEFDGVHLSPEGVDALTFYLSGIIDRVLSGEDVSPTAAPWTVLVPGAEGADVSDVQSALIDEGIEVRGGADGVFGYDTMAAVAEYQRQSGELQVTGAVDIATARALGVFDPEADGAEASPATSSPTQAEETAEDALGSTSAGGASPDAATTTAGRSPLTTAVLVSLAVAAGLALAVFARRRYVLRRRRARRWARVHPATSPHRSVADLRREDRAPVRREHPVATDHQYVENGGDRTPERSI